MKRNISSVLLLSLILSLLVLSGCSTYVPTKQVEKTQTFPKETAPSQIIKTENQWVMLNSTYLSPNYTISVSDDFETTNEVYSVNDVSIWYFEANEKAIVWCEDSGEFCTFKAYVFESQKIHTIYQTAEDSNFHPENIGIYHDIAYFCVIDYEQEEVRVLAYNIDSETTDEIYVVELREEMQPYSIHLENEYLNFMCSNQIKVLNLLNNETVYDSDLPSSVERVFDVSYDSIHDTCAIYYADSDSEDIGILKEGEDDICSVYTFAKSHYAYQDKIECYDGHIYWIIQANVSGDVADHYTFVDYNYLEHKPVQVDRAFEFCRQESTLYILRFNKGGNYTHIDLCQY